MISGDIPTKGQSNIKFMYRYMSNNYKYWIILAVNTPESLLCCPACAKFSQNHIHSIMNPVPTQEEEDEKETLLLLQKEFRNYRKILIHQRRVTQSDVQY